MQVYFFYNILYYYNYNKLIVLINMHPYYNMGKLFLQESNVVVFINKKKVSCTIRTTYLNKISYL